nr:ribonuclease H-like domain-containing protein [Tanacetum cinerariifolium]
MQPIEATIPAATYVPASPKSNSSGKRRNRKACFVCKSVVHLIKDCDYHTKKMAQPTPRNYAHRGHPKQYAPFTHSKPQMHRVLTAVFTQSKPVSHTAVRPVSAALPNIKVTRPRNAYQVVTKSKSPIQMHINRNPSSRTSNSPPRVNVVPVPVVSVVQGNMSYLSDFDELNEGYVSFRGNPKGVKITSKGKASNTEPLGIKREFGIPRTPQQNGIAERKNRTLIDAARTMLADSLLPISFWGKFQGKVNKGFLVEYSIYSKAFRVFNSRTCTIQETLHVNFLENKPNVAGTGPTWLFDIDSLTRTMNYQPVYAGNQTNTGAGFQDNFDAEKAGEEEQDDKIQKEAKGKSHVESVTGYRDLNAEFQDCSENSSNEDAAFDGKEHDFDVKKPESKVILSPSSSAQSKEQDDKIQKEAKGKSHVESVTGYRDLNAEFQDCSENSSNEVNAASSTVPTVGQNSLNITNTFSVVGPLNDDVSPTYRQTSDIDASQLPDDLDMPGLKDIIYSDDEDVVGAEADFNNLESSIPVKNKREKDKIKTKPDKDGKRGEARKSQEQSQWIKREKPNKTKKEWLKTHAQSRSY